MKRLFFSLLLIVNTLFAYDDVQIADYTEDGLANFNTYDNGSLVEYINTGHANYIPVKDSWQEYLMQNYDVSISGYRDDEPIFNISGTVYDSDEPSHYLLNEINDNPNTDIPVRVSLVDMIPSLFSSLAPMLAVLFSALLIILVIKFGMNKILSLLGVSTKSSRKGSKKK